MFCTVVGLRRSPHPADVYSVLLAYCSVVRFYCCCSQEAQHSSADDLLQKRLQLILSWGYHTTCKDEMYFSPTTAPSKTIGRPGITMYANIPTSSRTISWHVNGKASSKNWKGSDLSFAPMRQRKTPSPALFSFGSRPFSWSERVKLSPPGCLCLLL